MDSALTFISRMRATSVGGSVSSTKLNQRTLMTAGTTAAATTVTTTLTVNPTNMPTTSRQQTTMPAQVSPWPSNESCRPASVRQQEYFIHPKQPTWTSAMSIMVPIYRHALGSFSGSVRAARAFMNALFIPLPNGFTATPVSIPRRKGVLLPSLPHRLVDTNASTANAPTADDMISAEWIDWDESLSLESASNTQPKQSTQSTKRTSDKVILYIHGGGFVMCSPASHRHITSRLAKASNARIIAIDYRLAPEHPFPMPLHDVISAYLELINPHNPDQTPVAPSNIVIMGDSAGGGLAISLTLWLRDNGIAMPAAVIGLSPWLDLTHSQPSFRLNDHDYLPISSYDPEWIVPGTRSHYYTSHDAYNAHPLVSPMFARDVPSRPLPPILIHVGEQERLRDESLIFATKTIRSSPVRIELYDDQVHVFQAFAALNEAAPLLSIARIGEFIRSLDTLRSGTHRLMDSQNGPHKIITTPGVYRVDGKGEVSDIGVTGALTIIDNGHRVLEDRAIRAVLDAQHIQHQSISTFLSPFSSASYSNSRSITSRNSLSSDWISTLRSVKTTRTITVAAPLHSRSWSQSTTLSTSYTLSPTTDQQSSLIRHVAPDTTTNTRFSPVPFMRLV